MPTLHTIFRYFVRPTVLLCLGGHSAIRCDGNTSARCLLFPRWCSLFPTSNTGSSTAQSYNQLMCICMRFNLWRTSYTVQTEIYSQVM